MKYWITNQKKLRAEFWATFPELLRKKRGVDYVCETRVMFVDWIDGLQKDGQISEALAGRATL